MGMELYHEKYRIFVRLKKNYSNKDIIKGQHFRLLCDKTSDPESTYQEKVEQLRKNEYCMLDQDKYDQFLIPFPRVQVKGEDLQDITTEVLERGILFFTESSYFGSNEGHKELEEEKNEKNEEINKWAKDAFGSDSNDEYDIKDKKKE